MNSSTFAETGPQLSSLSFAESMGHVAQAFEFVCATVLVVRTHPFGSVGRQVAAEVAEQSGGLPGGGAIFGQERSCWAWRSSWRPTLSDSGRRSHAGERPHPGCDRAYPDDSHPLRSRSRASCPGAEQPRTSPLGRRATANDLADAVRSPGGRERTVARAARAGPRPQVHRDNLRGRCRLRLTATSPETVTPVRSLAYALVALRDVR